MNTFPNLEALADGRIGLNERLGDYIALRAEAQRALEVLRLIKCNPLPGNPCVKGGVFPICQDPVNCTAK